MHLSSLRVENPCFGKSHDPRGRISQYIPPLGSVLLHSSSQGGSHCFTNFKSYWSSVNQTTRFGRCFEWASIFMNDFCRCFEWASILCMSADNEEAIWLTYKFNSSFPSLCCRHPLRWPSVPNQTSTTGKNLIIAHPDSVAMDDTFLSRF